MDRMPLNADRKAAFLAELSRHGITMRAARAASPHSATGCLSTFADERFLCGLTETVPEGAAH